MLKKILLICSFFLSFVPSSFSQDISNSELNTKPLSINPAFTGMFTGDARASILYWNEWASVTVPFVTYSASFDMPVYSDSKGDYIAAGLTGNKTIAGDADLADFSGIGSIAFHKFFRPAHDTDNRHSSDLAIGVQAGYNQNSIGLYDLSPGGISVANGTSIYQMGIGNTVNSYSINAGICFSHAAGQHLNYTIGFAGYNLNQPKDAIEQQQNTRFGIDRRYIAEIGADWIVSDKLTLRPEILYQSQLTGTEFIAGGEFRYKVINKRTGYSNSTSVFIGGWGRSGDIMNVTAGVDSKRLRVGIGYDYNLAPLEESSNGYGAFSLTLRYIVPAQKLSGKKRAIPCSRF